MKESVNQKSFGNKLPVNLRVFNTVLSGTLAMLTFPGWASLFFAVCAWVAWTDKPTKGK